MSSQTKLTSESLKIERSSWQRTGCRGGEGPRVGDLSQGTLQSIPRSIYYGIPLRILDKSQLLKAPGVVGCTIKQTARSLAGFRKRETASGLTQGAFPRSYPLLPDSFGLGGLAGSKGARSTFTQINASSRESPRKEVPFSPPSTNWGPSVLSTSLSVLALICGALCIRLWTSGDIESSGPLLGFTLGAAFFASKFLEFDAYGGQFEQRDPGLSSDWHNLYDYYHKLTFYYNSLTKVSQWEPPDPSPEATPDPVDVSLTSDELVGAYLAAGTGQLFFTLLNLPITVGLLLAPLYEFLCLRDLVGGWSVFPWTAAFLSLPQPLPLLILALVSDLRGVLLLNGPLVNVWEAGLSLAILGSLVPEVMSLLATLDKAAQARLPTQKVTGDSSLLTKLACAVCPGLGWRLHPYAFDLTFERIVLLPLPQKVPLSVPIPRWEILPGSWVPLLFASPIIVPLARILVATIQAGKGGASTLSLEVVQEAFFSSPAILVAVCASVATVLIRTQRETYQQALKDRECEGNATTASTVDRTKKIFSLDDFEKMSKEDFDKRLEGGDK